MWFWGLGWGRLEASFPEVFSCLRAGQNSGQFVDGLFCPVRDHFWSLWKVLGAFRRTSGVPRNFYASCDLGQEWNFGSTGPVDRTQFGGFGPCGPRWLLRCSGPTLGPDTCASTPAAPPNSGLGTMPLRRTHSPLSSGEAPLLAVGGFPPLCAVGAGLGGISRARGRVLNYLHVHDLIF